jgi:phytoene synthase
VDTGLYLEASYRDCQELHRAHGRTYYLATRLLPRWKRPHVHALYGFTRYTDDIVDATDRTSPQQRATRLRAWTDQFWSAVGGSTVDDLVLPAVVHTMHAFGLDLADFQSFLHSMEMDLTVTEYATEEDLLEYMEGSAAVIGTMMLPILAAGTGREAGLGPEQLAAAREPARQLGLAFQYTNFIRDVGEDLKRGRLYLPLKDLAEFGVDRLDLLCGAPAVPRLIAYEVGRARQYYARAAAGVLLLPPSSQRCIRTAFRLYGQILDEVAKAGYDVSRRVTVSRRRRLSAAAAGLLTPAGRPVTLS